MAITQYIRRMGNKRHAAVFEQLDQYLAFSGDSAVTIGERINTIQNPELRAVLQAMVDYRDIPMSRSLVSKYVNSYSEALTRRVLQKMMDDSWYNPNLSLDFTAMRSLDSRITFSRGGDAATGFGSDGLLKTYGVNLILNSDNITAASWLKAAAGTGTVPVVTLNAGVDPDGAMTATRVVLDKGAGTLSADQSQISPNNDAVTAGLFSVWLKSNTGTTYTVRIGNAVPRNCSVTPVWQQFTTNGNTETNARISLRGTLGTSDYADILVWHPQHELGVTSPTEYVATTTAASGGARFNYDPSTPAGTTGVELLTNGDFSQGETGWVIFGTAGNVTVSNGQIRINAADGVNSGFSQVTFLTVGKRYRLTFNLISVTGTGVQVNDNAGPQYGTFATAGVQTLDFTASSVNLQFKRQSGVVDAIIDNISVQEVVFAPRGLMVEEARTNALLYSGNPLNNWANISSTPTAASGTGLGLFDNGCVIASTGAFWHRKQTTCGSGFSWVSGTTYAWTVFVTAGTSNGVFIVLRDNTAATETTIGGSFPSSIAVSGSNAGAATVSSVQLIGSVYKITGTFTPNSSPTFANCVLGVGPNSATVGQNITVWGAQLEAGATPSSYIPTGASTATRAADNASIGGAAFTSWWNASAGTFVAEWVDQNAGTGGTAGVFSVNDGSATNKIDFRADTGQTIGSGGSGWNIPTGNPSAATIHKIALAFTAGAQSISRDGAAAATASAAVLPSGINSLSLGYLDASPGSYRLNGHLRKLRFYPAALPLATLPALSA